jgi:arylsulfatase A-like enzyme
MDLQIGRVLQSLARTSIASITIVIFTSDNGGERYSNTWPFSGKKTELLEGGLRVPAIVRWPGVVSAGSTSDQVTISMDWLPTLLSAAGGRADPGFPADGIDLGAVLRTGSRPLPRTLCWRYLNLAQEACRDGDWKYLKILKNTFLFNVADDPQERANLKDRHPDIYQRLVAEYRSWEATMLPLDFEAFTSGFTGDTWADHFGVNRSRMTANDDD